MGYKASDMESEYKDYYDENLSELPKWVLAALETGPLPWDWLPDIDQAPHLQKEIYAKIEDGYAENKDGSIKVAVRTEMPGVTPLMWAWWFAWHGSQDRRYKLWHPRAHLSARWADGREEDLCYVGRDSIIDEYVGENRMEAAIRFKSPLEFGFDSNSINRTERAVYICAKIGHPSLPIDYGYLVHQVRAVNGGSEMRSRFWLGGKYAGLQKKSKLANTINKLLRVLKTLPRGFAPDLLRHCSEEMNHLAARLPRLYARFGSPQEETLPGRPPIAGSVYGADHSEFNKVVMGMLFNKTDPGGLPYMVAEPRTVEDVISVVRYAARAGKRLTVCSGGHSFSANFVRPGCILLHMKHFDQYQIDQEQMTAQAGPGVGGSTLMQALYKHNLFFPAGHCKGVCLGGYLLQGGYGWNGRRLGIACQSVLAVDVVTARGDLVHANEQENADLYWAARGAGPGFFGVVVRFYLQLHELPPYRAIMAHSFSIQHLEAVYRWAHEQGPSIPRSVEFQMLMSRNRSGILGPGIEALAPIFAYDRDEFEQAQAFMHQSPIKKKALIATPAFNPGIALLYKAVMSHYPSGRYWGVDNMWTHASIDELLPFIQQIAQTLPPSPSHFLWLNWYPGSLNQDMAYSKEDALYLALYGCWKRASYTPLYADWAADTMRAMEHLATGIQLADEGLHKRTADFMSREHLQRLQQIRQKYDPDGLFHEWHSRPDC